MKFNKYILIPLISIPAISAPIIILNNAINNNILDYDTNLYNPILNATATTQLEFGDIIVDVEYDALYPTNGCTISFNSYKYGATGNELLLNIPNYVTINNRDYNVTGIKNNGFTNIGRIYRIYGNSYLRGIGENAFMNCPDLYEYSNSNTNNVLTTISKNAFKGCTNLTRVDISTFTNLNTIAESAFENCTSLNNLSPLPDNIQILGKLSFANTGLVELTSTGTTLQTIGEYAFNKCTDLTRITFNSTLTTINEYAFDGCSSLNNINFSQITRLTTIKGYAFRGCSSLTRVDLSYSKLLKIDEYVFNNCTSLAEVNLPNDLALIETHAFDNSGIETLNIRNTKITTIGDYAFYNCTKLFGIMFPDILRKIGQYSFGNCVVLSKLDLSSIKYTLFQLSVGSFYNCNTLTNIDLGVKLTNIPERAFGNCIRLKNINFSPVLQRISKEAFLNCWDLTVYDELSKIVTLTRIDESAFESCVSINKLYIPPNLISVGKYAFKNCFNINEIIFPTTLDITTTNWDAESFANVYNNNLKIKVPYEKMNEYYNQLPINIRDYVSEYDIDNLKFIDPKAVIRQKLSGFQKYTVESNAGANANDVIWTLDRYYEDNNIDISIDEYGNLIWKNIGYGSYVVRINVTSKNSSANTFVVVLLENIFVDYDFSKVWIILGIAIGSIIFTYLVLASIDFYYYSIWPKRFAKKQEQGDI